MLSPEYSVNALHTLTVATLSYNFFSFSTTLTSTTRMQTDREVTAKVKGKMKSYEKQTHTPTSKPDFDVPLKLAVC